MASKAIRPESTLLAERRQQARELLSRNPDYQQAHVWIQESLVYVLAKYGPPRKLGVSGLTDLLLLDFFQHDDDAQSSDPTVTPDAMVIWCKARAMVTKMFPDGASKEDVVKALSPCVIAWQQDLDVLKNLEETEPFDQGQERTKDATVGEHVGDIAKTQGEAEI